MIKTKKNIKPVNDIRSEYNEYNPARSIHMVTFWITIALFSIFIFIRFIV